MNRRCRDGDVITARFLRGIGEDSDADSDAVEKNRWLVERTETKDALWRGKMYNRTQVAIVLLEPGGEFPEPVAGGVLRAGFFQRDDGLYNPKWFDLVSESK